MNQMVAVAMLASLGCRADVVANGREALAALERTSYALIFVDCQMPEMDGFAATRAIRDLERDGRAGGPPVPSPATRLPIVAMTAHALAEDRASCLAAGMDDYVSKPFTGEQLRAVLDRWLRPGVVGKASTAGSDGVMASGITPPGASGAEAPLNDGTLANLRALGGAGGGNLVARVMRVYLHDAPGLVAALRDAADREDAAAAQRTAHALKSSSANVGALRLAELCRQVEAAARAGRLEPLCQLVSALEAEYEQVALAASAHASDRDPRAAGPPLGAPPAVPSKGGAMMARERSTPGPNCGT